MEGTTESSKAGSFNNESLTDKSSGGVSKETFRRTTIHVSNADGHLCHISAESILPCVPSFIFAILTNPDNTGTFRDIKALGKRILLQDSPGYKVIEVEQQGEIKIAWRRHQFSTFVSVIEDSRDPAALKSTFSLIKSDVLSKFQGTWTLRPGPPSEEGPTAAVSLEQDILPRGVPVFVKHLPVLSQILRGVCVRTVRRLLEDIEAVIRQPNKFSLAIQNLPMARAAGSSRLEAHAIAHFTDSESETEASER